MIFESSESDHETESKISDNISKNIIEEAEKKAKEIIEKAHEEAENIINEAHLAYAEEVEKGRKDGKEQAEIEVNNLVEEYSKQLNDILKSFENSIDLEIHNVRILLFNILKVLIYKFLNDEIFSSPKWVENSLNKILEKFINMNQIKIHVSPNIMKKYPEIIEKFNAVDNIEIIEDIRLNDFSMSVHTEMGKISINKDDIIKDVTKIIEEELNDERL